MRDLFLVLVYAGLLSLGFLAPFAAGLGYLWVDMFAPQNVAWSTSIFQSPSMIAGVTTFLFFLVLGRKDVPKSRFGLALLLLWGLWTTLTTTWAVAPEAAWEKWNWAVKTICFAAFAPFIFRSQTQLEAMLLTVIFSLAGNLIAVGAKTVLTGGGYGYQITLFPGNSGLAEGSSLALTAAAAVPMLLVLARHSRIMPARRWSRMLLYGLAAAAILTVIGTHTRTGLVALVTLGAVLWWNAKRKVVVAIVYLVLALAGAQLVSDSWTERMWTIAEYERETSAFGRIAVWRWTLQFVQDHPLGGGFAAYKVDEATVPFEGSTSGWLTIQAKAFHSIYFEVLGEHGIVGGVIYCLLILTTLRNLGLTVRAARASPADHWLAAISRSLRMSVIVYLVGGAFAGVAFQPFLYYIISASISLRELSRRLPASQVHSSSVEKLPARKEP